MRTTLGTANAGDDVRAAVHRLGPQFEREYIAHTTLSHWSDIMGEMVARRVRAVAIKDGKLFLYAPDATWKNEMRMTMPDTIQRVNNYARHALPPFRQRTGRIRRHAPPTHAPSCRRG